MPEVEGFPQRYIETCTWDDVPHLTPESKAELLKTIPPYQRDARTKGVPQLGAGAIYPIAETDLQCDIFEIPEYWPRAYALDVGWDVTAAVWGARDNQAGVIYLYSEHYRGHEEPAVHVSAIQGRGKWIPGVIDPAANGRSQEDGSQLLVKYRAQGLSLEPAKNAEEAGIFEVWNLMSGGRLRVFKNLSNWWKEFRGYVRDKHGRVKNSQKYHLMACTRYFALSGVGRLKTKPVERPARSERSGRSGSDTGWMGN